MTIDSDNLINKAIPSQNNPIYNRNLNLIDEEFVEVKSENGIIVEMQYPLLKMENAVNKAFLRKTVANMLMDARKLLPKEYQIKILDAWRPLELQKELYYKYKEDIITQFHLENLSKEELEKEIAKYVSLPVEDIEMAPLHATGGAIDVILTDAEGNDLDFGAGFDVFSDKTYTDYFEKNDQFETIRKNRRILYYVMTSVRFCELTIRILAL